MEKRRQEDCDQACNENEHSDRGFIYGDDIFDEESAENGAAIVYAIIGTGIIAIIVMACLLL